MTTAPSYMPASMSPSIAAVSRSRASLSSPAPVACAVTALLRRWRARGYPASGALRILEQQCLQPRAVVAVDLAVALDEALAVVGVQEREHLAVAVDPDLPDVAVGGQREQAQRAGDDEVDVRLQLAIAAGHDRDRAEVGARRAGCGDVAALERVDELVQALGHLVAVRRRKVLDAPLHAGAGEHAHDVDELERVLLRDLRDAPRAVGRDVDEPLRCQLRDRLADRGDADAEARGDLRVLEDAAGRQRAAHDLLAQLALDGLAAGEGDRVRHGRILRRRPAARTRPAAPWAGSTQASPPAPARSPRTPSPPRRRTSRGTRRRRRCRP